MTLTDGAIMFTACVLSFTIGYVIGAVRVSRFVTKQLNSLRTNVEEIQKHSRELHQFYSRLDEKPE